MNEGSQPGSLTTRLLISQIGVLVAVTMAVVTPIAGPALFEAHT